MGLVGEQLPHQSGTYLGEPSSGGGPGRLLRGDRGKGQQGRGLYGQVPCPVVPTLQG